MSFGTPLVPLLDKASVPSKGPPPRNSTKKESSKGGISVSALSGSNLFGLLIEGGAISDPIIKVDSGVTTKRTTKILKRDYVRFKHKLTIFRIVG